MDFRLAGLSFAAFPKGLLSPGATTSLRLTQENSSCLSALALWLATCITYVRSQY